VEDGRYLCSDCRRKEAEAELRPKRLSGCQPAICVECATPFVATRIGVKFCSS
jgi:hypothetical protein